MLNLEEKSSILSLSLSLSLTQKRMHVEIKKSNTSDKSIRGVCWLHLFNAIYELNKAANDSKTSVKQDL